MNLPTVSRRLFLAGAALAAIAPARAFAGDGDFASSTWRKLSDDQWRSRLSPAAFNILRREGTEPAGSSPLLEEHRKGVFACAGCALPLFDSDWKYESGTGWPSFFQVNHKNIGRKRDMALGYARTEYHCARCLGHQGHVFDDGPEPTGLRYCNDGLALRFIPA